MVEVTRGTARARQLDQLVRRDPAREGGRRLLPIWIGQPEAESIVMQMNQVKRERPLTHDLCKALISSLGGTLRRVEITRVAEEHVFRRAAHRARRTGSCRSMRGRRDSIAIALRLDAPIFAPTSRC